MFLKQRIKACYVLLIALQTILFKNARTPFSWHTVGWQTSSTRGISPSVSFCFLELKEDAVWQSKESYLSANLTCLWVIHFDKTKPGRFHLILCMVTPVDVTVAATWTQSRIQLVTHINTCEFKDMLCLYQKTFAQWLIFYRIHEYAEIHSQTP